jgi:hypothetical protein
MNTEGRDNEGAAYASGGITPYAIASSQIHAARDALVGDVLPRQTCHRQSQAIAWSLRAKP